MAKPREGSSEFICGILTIGSDSGRQKMIKANVCCLFVDFQKVETLNSAKSSNAVGRSWGKEFAFQLRSNIRTKRKTGSGKK